MSDPVGRLVAQQPFVAFPTSEYGDDCYGDADD